MTTLAEAQAKLAEYLAAESAVLQGKEVRLGGPGMDRWHRMEDLPEIRKGRAEWERRIASMSAASAGLSTLGGVTFTRARFD
jgi:hypothetical protein